MIRSLIRWRRPKNKSNICRGCGRILELPPDYEPAASDINAEWVIVFCKECKLSVNVLAKKKSRSIIWKVGPYPDNPVRFPYSDNPVRLPYPDNPVRLPLCRGISASKSERRLMRNMFGGGQEIRRSKYGQKSRRLNSELVSSRASGRIWTKDVFGKKAKTVIKPFDTIEENDQEMKSIVGTLRSSYNTVLKRGKSYRR